MTETIKLENVSYGYINGNKRIDILNNANVSFEKGLMYTILGPSGSGKTTTLALAGGLDSPSKGKVLFENNDIRKIGYTRYRKKNVSFIFQNNNLINYMTALENVVTAMSISGSYKDDRKVEAMEILKNLGLIEDEARRSVMKLSGGQQQRVAIARAIAMNTDAILADEPTGNLDVNTAKEIISIFQELAHKYNKCVIVVSHSHEVAESSDKVFRFENGGLN